MIPKVSSLRAAVTNLGSHVSTRGKRTVKQAPGASRIINMLSVLSARKKQPRRLKLCKEDLARHEVVHAAWGIHQRDTQQARRQKMQVQYEKIKEACDELQKLDPALFQAANARPAARFPIELRVPTETPPKTAWEFDWEPVKK